MARDEMKQITEDRWDENIWGVEHEDIDHKYRVPKLVFYFGEKVGFVQDGWWVKADRVGSLGCGPYSRCVDCC
jgi:hypothetical protein